MRSVRNIKRLSALAILTAAVAGCGETSVVEHEHVYRNEPAPVYQSQPAYGGPAVAQAPPPPNYDVSAPVDTYGADNNVNVQADVIDETPDNQDAQYFQQDLAPYGDWVQTTDYGQCWRPRGVAADWQPYTDGHWVYTDDAGWLWVSAEPFGDITCHYGRWFQDPQQGWCWVPGTVWAASWCSFREGGGVIAWAPLPPLRYGEHDVRVDTVYSRIRPENYVYVDERNIVDPNLSREIHRGRENVTIVNNTRNITNYGVQNNRVVNRSVNVSNVEKATGKQVQHLKVTTTDRPGQTKVNGNEVAVFQKKDLPQKKEVKPAESRNTVQHPQPQANVQQQNRQTLESQQAQRQREAAQENARTASERQQAETDQHTAADNHAKAEADQRAQAQAQQRAADENKAKIEADNHTRAEQQAQQQAQQRSAENQAKTEENHARTEQQTQQQAQQNQAKTEADNRAKADADARAHQEQEAQQHANENQAKAQDDERARAQQQNAQAENRAKVESDDRAKAEADDRAKAQADDRARTASEHVAPDEHSKADDHPRADDHSKAQDDHRSDQASKSDNQKKDDDRKQEQ
jgi:hypothetical protein